MRRVLQDFWGPLRETGNSGTFRLLVEDKLPTVTDALGVIIGVVKKKCKSFAEVTGASAVYSFRDVVYGRRFGAAGTHVSP